jgi:hypothetical protein
MEEVASAYKIIVETPEEKRIWETWAYGRIMLKFI